MRRPHRKSRTGCLQCRQRKIKCDENKPSCHYCTRHSTRCSYNAAPFGTPANPFKSPEPSPLNHSPVAGDAVPVLTQGTTYKDLTWSDLELLHNYSTSTYMTLARRLEDYYLWQNTVPQLAFQSPFLMHGIFAISALHLASLHPERSNELILSASKHQHIALQEFRAALSGEITKDNCNAIFAASILLAACSMGSQQPEEEPASYETGQASVAPEWMSLLRGTYALLASAWAWIQEGPLAQILQQDGLILDCPVGIDDSHLLTLSTLFDDPASTPTPPTPEAEERIATYRAALQELRDAFLFSYIFSPGGICQSKKWSSLRYVVSVQEDYMKLLIKREPEALILLAYECVLLRREPPCWYMAGHAQHLMGIIRRNLTPEWLHWIEWPSSIVDAG